MKEFVDFYTVRNNGLLLGKKIEESGFWPDIIYMVLRGGCYLANVLSEYFHFIANGRNIPLVAAVVCRSYDGLNNTDSLSMRGWTYDPSNLKTHNKVLLVDDIFDSGRTLNRIAQQINACGIPRENLKLIVHDYKVKHYDNKQIQLPFQPDFFCRRFDFNSPQEELWIHYLSHELIGLTEDEFKQEYQKPFKELQNFSLKSPSVPQEP